jgi:outer membrane protein OmpA-like peptidoglycan-associated protein
VAALGLFLGACSAVPDWANPVEWYDGMFGRRSTQTAASTVPKKQTEQGDTSRGFPNLATVPERPRPTAAEEQQAMQAGLVGDRKNAKYVDDVVRGRAIEPAAVAFEGVSGRLDSAGQAALRRIADRQKLAGGGVRVVGYEPMVPLANRDKTLPPVSLDRARAVAAELVRHGVNPQSIKVEGSAAREQAGRQAEIFLEN